MTQMDCLKIWWKKLPPTNYKLTSIIHITIAKPIKQAKKIIKLYILSFNEF